MIELVVKPDGAGQRVDKLVRKLLKAVPLSHVYKMFRTKKVRVNGARAQHDYLLKVGDKVTIRGEEKTLVGNASARPENTKRVEGAVRKDFAVVFEDEHLLVVDKPSGLAIHPGTGIHGATLVDQARAYLGGTWPEGEFKPSPAHRLDRETSGVVIVAKTRKAMIGLTEQFTNAHPDKRYLTLAKGRFHKDSGEIDLRLSEHQQTLASKEERGVNMQEALTKWRVVARGHDCALLECRIETGRTHQIRRHLASIGHPVVGDAKYGDFPFNRRAKADWGVKRQMLHAAYLRVRHPIVGNSLEFKAALPEDFVDACKRAGVALPAPE